MLSDFEQRIYDYRKELVEQTNQSVSNNLIIKAYVAVKFLSDTDMPVIIHTPINDITDDGNIKQSINENDTCDINILFKYYPNLYDSIISSESVTRINSTTGNSDAISYMYKTKDYVILVIMHEYYYNKFNQLKLFVEEIQNNKKLRKEVIQYHKVCSCGTTYKLKKCAGCKKVYYCSKECQVNARKNHKSNCSYELTYQEAIKKFQIYDESE